MTDTNTVEQVVEEQPEVSTEQPTATAAVPSAAEVEGDIASTKAKFIFRNLKDTPEAERKEPVELDLPYLTKTGLINLILEMAEAENQKQLEYIVDIVNDRIYDAADDQVRDKDNPVATQDQLDLTKLTLEYLANVPVSQRKTSGLSKELWEEFKSSYVPLMEEATGKPKEKLENQVKIFFNRLQQIKTRKDIMELVRPQLDIWYSKALKTDDDREKFAPLYKYLNEKFDEYMKTDDAALLESLV